MKNKFLLTLFALIFLGGCSSVQEEEQEEPEVLLYKQSQDRINANNYIGAVESRGYMVGSILAHELNKGLVLFYLLGIGFTMGFTVGFYYRELQ